MNARGIRKVGFAYFEWLLVGSGAEGKEDDSNSEVCLGERWYQ